MVIRLIKVLGTDTKDSLQLLINQGMRIKCDDTSRIKRYVMEETSICERIDYFMKDYFMITHLFVDRIRPKCQM